MKNIWTFQKIIQEISRDNKEERRNQDATDLRKKCIKENKYVHIDPIIDLDHDIFVNGQSIEYPHGITSSFGSKSFYYRGQIKDYGECNSSLKRHLNLKKSDPDEILIFINELKIRDFGFELDKLKQVQNWWENIGDVFGFTIAQHFGMPTNIIDITDNLKIALFFATCIHTKNNRYRPFRKKDLKKYKYGVLYIRNRVDELTGKLEVYPIGYQPFTRCHKQKGHFIIDSLKNDFDIEKVGFKKIYFKHNLKLSRNIFNHFEKGKKLFSYSKSKEIQNLIEVINRSNEHSLKSFEETYLNLGLTTKKEDLLEILKLNNIFIVDHKSFLRKNIIEKLDKEWDLKKFEENEKIIFGYRKCIFPG